MTMALPVEVCDLIAVFANAEPSWVVEPAWHRRPGRGKDHRAASRSLQSLRLVNKSFCKSASLALFRRMQVVSCCTLGYLLATSESQYASDVDEIIVGAHLWDREYENSHLQGFLDDLSTVLPMSLRLLPNLRVVTVESPRIRKSSLCEISRRTFLKGLNDSFRFGNFDKIKELNLSLSHVDDLADILRLASLGEMPNHPSPLRKIVSRISYIRFHFQDFRIRSGFRYQTFETIAPPPLPKLDLSGLFKMLSMAENLAYLSIDRLYLHDDILDKLPLFNGLRALELCRVRTMWQTLEILLLGCVSTLCALELRLVELEGGTWDQLLQCLQGLTHLRYFHVESSGYSPRCPHYARRRKSTCFNTDGCPVSIDKQGYFPQDDDSESDDIAGEDSDPGGHLLPSDMSATGLQSERTEEGDCEISDFGPMFLVFIPAAITTDLSKDLSALDDLERHVEQVRKADGFLVGSALHEPLFPHRPLRTRLGSPEGQRRVIKRLGDYDGYDSQRCYDVVLNVVGQGQIKSCAAHANVIMDVPSFCCHGGNWELVIEKARTFVNGMTRFENVKKMFEDELVQLFRH